MTKQSLALSRSDVVEKRPQALIKDFGVRKIGRMSCSGYLSKAGARNLLRMYFEPGTKSAFFSPTITRVGTAIDGRVSST
jgi:hypothetical protein